MRIKYLFSSEQPLKFISEQISLRLSPYYFKYFSDIFRQRRKKKHFIRMLTCERILRAFTLLSKFGFVDDLTEISEGFSSTILLLDDFFRSSVSDESCSAVSLLDWLLSAGGVVPERDNGLRAEVALRIYFSWFFGMSWIDLNKKKLFKLDEFGTFWTKFKF